MFKPLSVLVISTLVLTSCSTVRDSRMNPFNWFGRSTSEPVRATDVGDSNPLIPARRRNPLGLVTSNEDAPYVAPPIAQISELLVERRSGGAILRVTGIADRPGPYEVKLVKSTGVTDPGVLSYDMRAYQQPGPRNTGPLARTVIAATWLSDQDLAGIRSIRVAGRDNAQVSRR